MLPVGVVIVALLVAKEERPILERVPQLQSLAYAARRGALGCGVGTLELVTSRGVVTARTGLDPIHVFGQKVKTADILALLKSRAESTRTGKPGPMSDKVDDLCHVCLSALAVSKEPNAVPVLSELLADPNDRIRKEAARALFRLGDSDETLRPEIKKVRLPKEAFDPNEQPPKWLNLNK